MGTWGPALFDDDNALDLKDTLKLICKVPLPGDRLLDALKGIYGDCDPSDEEGALFWLVTADQFERRGIECQQATSTALSIIENGSDLKFAGEKGADEAFLRKRAVALAELAKRLKAPRGFRPRLPPRKLPAMVVSTGEIHAFPTMNGYAWTPWRLDEQGPFTPDGWGALVVLATGRAFDWLPWVAVASLTVEPDRKPTLQDALRARLIFHSQTAGAGRYIPKPSHARNMGLELVVRTVLDEQLVEPHLSKWGVAWAIEHDWPICYGAFGLKAKDAPRGCELSSLVKEAG
jgi:hypothetical protein